MIDTKADSKKKVKNRRMLDHAVRYTDELQKLFLDIADDLDFQYLFGCSYRDRYEAATSTWNKRECVSVYKGRVIGYFKYGIDRDSDIANGFQIVNFAKVTNAIFAKDLIRFIRDIFEKYKIRKLNFVCYTDNPILKSYIRLCEKYGGRIVGTKTNEDKLLDGEYHDLMLFEILRDDYLKSV